MPRRSKFGDLSDMEVKQIHCVTLGGKHAPVPLPVVEELGVTLVPLHASADWLTKLVGLGSRGDAHLVVKEFVDGVLNTLSGERPAADDAAGEAEERSSAAAGSAPAGEPKGRAAMGLDADSDEGEVAALDVEARASKKRKPESKKVDATARQEMRTISYAGIKLEFKPRWKCHGILVPAEGDTLPEILKYLRGKLLKGEAPGPDCKKKARRKEVVANREDEDAGRIRWLWADHSYQVCYTGAKGAKHTCAKHI